MTHPIARCLSLCRKILFAVAALVSIAGPIAVGILHVPLSRAQSHPTVSPAFEVASVKRSNTASTRTGVGTDPGRLTITNASLRLCIAWAYGVKDYQISGPAWLDSENFDIVAKAGRPVLEDRLRPMLQTLLAERFKLALHRDTRELPVYALAIGKDGPKFHEVKPGGNTRTRGGRGHLAGQRISMSQFADLLTQAAPHEIDRPVIDRTGLKGTFDITLEWTPGNPRPSTASETGGVIESAPGPDIFRALQQQLGLRLEAKKASVEILVIDRAEKLPTEN